MRLKNKDIAKALGISTTAVSLALNNRPGVSEETRKRVFAFIQRNAAPYSILEPADIPVPESTGTILLCVHKTHGAIINDKPFFQELPENIQQEAMRQHYTVMLIHYLPGQNTDQYFAYLKSLKFDGIIIIATELDRETLQLYKTLNVPIVLTDASFDLEAIDSVALDNQTSMFRAFDYAYRMGHREIGLLQSSVFINNFGHHFDGFMKGLREYGLESSNHPIIPLAPNVEGAYRDMKQFLADPPQDFKMPTLFLSDLDYIAMGAMRALKEAGYRIPEDISIIGYDDVAGCEATDPPLTTTRVNRADIGRLSMIRLADRLKEPGSYYSTMQVSSQLVIRSSVKQIHADDI